MYIIKDRESNNGYSSSFFSRLLENFFHVKISIETLKSPLSLEESLDVMQLSRSNRRASKKNMIQSWAQNFERIRTSSMTDWKVSSGILVEEKILDRKKKEEKRNSPSLFHTKLLYSNSTFLLFSPIRLTCACIWILSGVEKCGQVVVHLMRWEIARGWCEAGGLTFGGYKFRLRP